MSDDELNTDTWNIDDIFELFDLDEEERNASKLIESAKEKRDEMLKQIRGEKRGKYSSFFNSAIEELTTYVQDNITDDYEASPDESDADRNISEVETDESESDRIESVKLEDERNEPVYEGFDSMNSSMETLNRKTKLSGDIRATQEKYDSQIPKSYANVPFVEGSLNPIYQNTYHSWVNIDSANREILQSGGNSVVPICNTANAYESQKNQVDSNTIKKAGTSTDFTTRLATSLKNVMSMTLTSISFDISDYYILSEDYGNINFHIDNGKETEIKVEGRNYTITDLEKAINDEIENKDVSGIKIKINPKNKKTYFYGKPEKKAEWNDGENLRTPRSFLTCIVDKNNIIYAIGGKDSSDNVLDDIEYFDPRIPDVGWVHYEHRMKSKRKFATSVISSDGRIFVIGGENEIGDYLDTVEYLDLKNPDNGWTMMSYKLEKGIKHAASVITSDNKIYVMGGVYELHGNSFDYTYQMYDLNNPNAGWVRKGTMKTRRAHSCALIKGDIIYNIGGINSRYISMIEKLDLSVANPKWENAGDSGIYRKDFGCSLDIDGNIMIVGGEPNTSDNGNTRLLEISGTDIVIPDSEEESNLKEPRLGFGYVTDSRNNFYVIGGEKNDESDEVITDKTTEKYKLNIDLVWYDPKESVQQTCGTVLKTNTGKKLNSSLGYNLGFRELRTSFKKVDADSLKLLKDFLLDDEPDPTMYVVSTSVYDLTGTKYILLEVDDFNKNRGTGEMSTMSMPNHNDKIKLPSYAKTVMPICTSAENETVFGEVNEHGEFITYRVDPKDGHKKRVNTGIKGEKMDIKCRKGTNTIINTDLEDSNTNIRYNGVDNLTKAQKFTLLQIANDRRKKITDQYYSPYSENLLYRANIERPSNIDEHSQIVIHNLYGKEFSRTYFGPVTIDKLRIRLLDDRGNPINLNGGDISLGLVFERLYQN